MREQKVLDNAPACSAAGRKCRITRCAFLSGMTPMHQFHASEAVEQPTVCDSGFQKNDLGFLMMARGGMGGGNMEGFNLMLAMQDSHSKVDKKFRSDTLKFLANKRWAFRVNAAAAQKALRHVRLKDGRAYVARMQRSDRRVAAATRAIVELLNAQVPKDEIRQSLSSSEATSGGYVVIGKKDAVAYYKAVCQATGMMGFAGFPGGYIKSQIMPYMLHVVIDLRQGQRKMYAGVRIPSSDTNIMSMMMMDGGTSFIRTKMPFEIAEGTLQSRNKKVVLADICRDLQDPVVFDDFVRKLEGSCQASFALNSKDNMSIAKVSMAAQQLRIIRESNEPLEHRLQMLERLNSEMEGKLFASADTAAMIFNMMGGQDMNSMMAMLPTAFFNHYADKYGLKVMKEHMEDKGVVTRLVELLGSKSATHFESEVLTTCDIQSFGQVPCVILTDSVEHARALADRVNKADAVDVLKVYDDF